MKFKNYNLQGYNLASNYTYSWSPSGETTSSITATAKSATTTYTVDVTSGTTTCQSDVTITVNPSPTVDLGADIVLCNGDNSNARCWVACFLPMVHRSNYPNNRHKYKWNLLCDGTRCYRMRCEMIL